MQVVITGASKGLGRAMAEIYANHGHTLLVCARNEYQLYKMVEELSVQYPQSIIRAMPADLAIYEQVMAFSEWVIAEAGCPDILINNAGQFLPGSIAHEAPGTLESMLQANLMSAYHLTRSFLPIMTERKEGHIFNICSIASLQAYPNGGSYSISKFAMLGFSKNLREELKEFGIKVTSVMPGAAYTDSWSGSGVDPQRIMQADDVAKMVYAASQLSFQACVEEIVLRPQLGDL
ncbi:MAG: SDR family NAD(P)-dependent oxidoreductase [Hydrotalea sp.]|nr:SDR family NAD(P)-dependent oxidoreductase [Hydrotalea sp.]